MSKPIQEQFGQAIISAVAQFASVDLEKPATLVAGSLAHIGDATLRRRLAEVWYGARWIYKLGLALLVKNEEQVAHVRAQIVDYASVCEGILLDMIDHSMGSGRLTGVKYKYKDPAQSRQPITWRVGSHKKQLERMPFYWFIVVAEEESIISAATATKLHELRKHRNHVHIRTRTHAAYLSKSKDAFDTVLRTVQDTSQWKAANP